MKKLTKILCLLLAVLMVAGLFAVRGKMILPSHGKEFFQLTVSSFFHCLVITFLPA